MLPTTTRQEFRPRRARVPVKIRFTNNPFPGRLSPACRRASTSIGEAAHDRGYRRRPSRERSATGALFVAGIMLATLTDATREHRAVTRARYIIGDTHATPDELPGSTSDIPS